MAVGGLLENKERAHGERWGGNMSPMSKPRSAAMVIGEGICGQYHSTENRPGPEVVLWVVVIEELLKN